MTPIQKMSGAAVLILLGVASVFLGAWLHRNHRPHPTPQAVVVYIDVGDGDCTLVRAPGGETILLDTGSAATAPHVINVLHRFHVRTIDLLVLASPRAESIGGVPALVNAFPVRLVWDNALESRREARRSALATIRSRHIPSKIVYDGDTLQIGAETFWKTLWPPQHGGASREDTLVLQMDYGGTRFLFTGTASADTETDLVAGLGESLACTTDCSDMILQAPRGGAQNGTTSELLRSAAPSAVVVSCSGALDHPSQGVLHRLQTAGAEVWRTDTMGSVIVLTDGKSTPVISTQRF